MTLPRFGLTISFPSWHVKNRDYFAFLQKLLGHRVTPHKTGTNPGKPGRMVTLLYAVVYFSCACCWQAMMWHEAPTTFIKSRWLLVMHITLCAMRSYVLVMTSSQSSDPFYQASLTLSATPRYLLICFLTLLMEVHSQLQ